MTMTQVEALDAMLQHHRTLVGDVDARIRVLAEAVDSGTTYQPAVVELITYLAEEVIPHAVAEELSIYRTAATLTDLTASVNGMISEHRALVAAVESLATAPSGPAALSKAMQIAALFSAHVVKENELLLPALVEDDGVDLVELLKNMHHLTENSDDTPRPLDVPASDSEGIVLSLLLEAATDLTNAGLGDRACKLVASAWAALRSSRPELAVKTTASLHRLSRTLASEPIELRSRAKNTTTGPMCELDVRHLAPAQRHETIFAKYHALTPGAGYVLVNDHDPKPLRYQFEAEHAGEFTWEAVESGADVWRVAISKPLPDATASANLGSDEESNVQVLDVRVLPHGQRHEIIFSAYDNLTPGEDFVIVNDHDPKPLRYQFEAQHAGEFTWDYLESGPKMWRVRVGRTTVSTSA